MCGNILHMDLPYCLINEITMVADFTVWSVEKVHFISFLIHSKIAMLV